MKSKISNTLFVLSVVLFIVGVLFNWEQAKQSVNSGLAKARKVKSDIAKKKKAEESKSDNKKEVKKTTDHMDKNTPLNDTNGVIKENGFVQLEEIELIKSKF